MAVLLVLVEVVVEVLVELNNRNVVVWEGEEEGKEQGNNSSDKQNEEEMI